MTITEIVDKIVKEADLNPAEYSVADRIDDVNSDYLFYIEKAMQIGSKEPISAAESISETFTVVDATSDSDNIFTRTIKDSPIFRVDFKQTGASDWVRVCEDIGRLIGGCKCLRSRFFADEKRVWVENGVSGTLRVTYARGNINLFDTTDYSMSTPPSPDWLPETFHPLLWLGSAVRQAGYYKKDRYQSLALQQQKLEQLFYTHYSRNSLNAGSVETKDSDCCESDNYR